MLGDHLDGVLLLDARVERVPEALEEDAELGPHLLVGGDQLADALYVALRYPRNVLRPFVPVDARAALLDEGRRDGFLPPFDWEEGELELHALGDLGGTPLLALLVRREPVVPALVAVGAGVDPVLAGALLEGECVDLCLDSLVMASQCLQHAPDVCEHLAVVERLLGRHAGGDENGEDDVAEVLPLGAAHDAADRLHDVDRGVLGVEEDHRVEAGHVDALREAARVGEYPALPLGDIATEPGELPVPVRGVHAAVDVVEHAFEPEVLAPGLGVPVDDARERLADGLGGVDRRAEPHRPMQGLYALPGLRVHVVDDQHVAYPRGVLGSVLAVLREALPAADDLADIVVV